LRHSCATVAPQLRHFPLFFVFSPFDLEWIMDLSFFFFFSQFLFINFFFFFFFFYYSC